MLSFQRLRETEIPGLYQNLSGPLSFGDSLVEAIVAERIFGIRIRRQVHHLAIAVPASSNPLEHITTTLKNSSTLIFSVHARAVKEIREIPGFFSEMRCMLLDINAGFYLDLPFVSRWTEERAYTVAGTNCF